MKTAWTLGLGALALGALAWAGAPEDLVKATDLPLAAQRLRAAGVEEGEVKGVLGGVRERGLRAGETAEVLDAAAESAREHGPVDNFGAFVQERLGEGLRGQDLAAAIRAEHEARGAKHQGGPPEGKGPDAEHGKPAGPQKAGAGADEPGPRGKPAPGLGRPSGPPEKGKARPGGPDGAPGKGKQETP